MLDEYTYGPTYHKDIHAKGDFENNSTFTSLSSTENNGKINDFNHQEEISFAAVKKYVQAWITYLQETDHTEKDHLVCIAEKHLHELEKESINTKLQTKIQSYLIQSK